MVISYSAIGVGTCVWNYFYLYVIINFMVTFNKQI